MKFIWNDEKKTYDIVFTPDTLFKGLDDGKEKHWVTRPFRKEVVEVINIWKRKLLLESLGIKNTDKILCITLFNSILSKNDICIAMLNKARAIRKRHDLITNASREYFLYLMRDNDIDVINWDVDFVDGKYKYSVEYNELIYKNRYDT